MVDPGDDALLWIKFIVRDPEAPKNHRPLGRGNKLSWAAVKEKERIQTIAFAARERGGWPKNPFQIRRARMTLQAYGGKWDAGAFDTLTRDACQKVLYYDDRQLENGPQRPAYDDGGGRRLEVMVELLEVWSPATARQIEAEVRARAARYEANKDKRRLGDVRAQLPLASYPLRRKYGRR